MVPASTPPAEVPPRYILRLYISGASPRSTQAVRNVRAIFTMHLSGDDVLEIVDVYQQRALAADDEIVVTPTLIRKLPRPVLRFMGDMSNTQEIIAALGLGVVPGKRAGTPSTPSTL